MIIVPMADIEKRLYNIYYDRIVICNGYMQLKIKGMVIAQFNAIELLRLFGISLCTELKYKITDKGIERQ